MVQSASDDRHLDSVILDVFEKAGSLNADRHFYFPVTSQADARAFVCQLHSLGVPYQTMYTAVGESEPNFTSWRMGISRAGVGNRVLERINRPLQQLLLAVADEDGAMVDDVEDDVTLLEEFTTSVVMATAKQRETATCTSYARTRDGGANNHAHVHGPAHRAPPSVTTTAGCMESEENNNNTKLIEAAAAKNTQETQRMRRASEEAGTTEKTSGSSDNADAKGNEEKMNRTIELSSQNASDTETGSQHLIAVTSTAVVVNADQQSSNTSAATTSNITDMDSRNSNTKGYTANDSDKPEVTSPANNCMNALAMIDCSGESAGCIATAEPRISPEVNGHITLAEPETQTTTATADVEDNPAEPEIVETKSDELDSAKNSHATPSEPEITSPRPDATSTGDRKRVAMRAARKPAEERAVDEVDESYDSDDDFADRQNGSSSSAVAGLDQKFRDRQRRWGRHFEDDGAGYVYVFTDTAAKDCSTSCRVKVSASRRPESRLRQAQLFNIDIRLVTAVQVTKRLAAACLLRRTLIDSHCAIPGTVDWFNTSLDVVMSAAMNVSQLYAPPTV